MNDYKLGKLVSEDLREGLSDAFTTSIMDTLDDKVEERFGRSLWKAITARLYVDIESSLDSCLRRALDVKLRPW